MVILSHGLKLPKLLQYHSEISVHLILTYAYTHTDMQIAFGFHCVVLLEKTNKITL